MCDIFTVGNTGRARGNISHDIFLSTAFRCNRRWRIAKAERGGQRVAFRRNQRWLIAKAERGKEKVSATEAAVAAAAAAVADAVVVVKERAAAAVTAAAGIELS